jgi:triosephosphate isomerase
MPVTVAVSLKMYFGHTAALKWCQSVAEIACRSRAVAEGSVRLVVLPSFPALAPANDLFAGTHVVLGAQDLFWEDSGPYTGEVSGTELAELGCGVVAVGHAERRSLLGESEDVVTRKVAAATRNGLIPLICVGEQERQSVDEVSRRVVGQVHSAVREARPGPLIVAYEPIWAIGAREPAAHDYITAVTRRLREALRDLGDHPDSAVIYGGSAGPGLLSALGADVDGLFLGRFAHDPHSLIQVLDEAGRTS